MKVNIKEKQQVTMCLHNTICKVFLLRYKPDSGYSCEYTGSARVREIH